MLNHLRKSRVRIFDIAIVLAAFLGAAHILIRTSNFGPELDLDTWKYISAAENLAAGEGFKDYLQRTNINAGPLYSMFLALFGLLGINPVDAGRFVNIVGFGLIILLTGYQLNRQVKFHFLAVVGSVTIMTSYFLSRISAYLMTDTLFILFALLALFKIQMFTESEDPPPSLLALSALFTGVAIATRYVGISVLLTGIISIFLKQNFQILRRLKCAVIYGSLSIIPFGVWMARNWLFDKTLVRYGNYGSSTLDYLETFSKLFVHRILVLSPGYDWFIYLICTAAFLILWRKYAADKVSTSSWPNSSRSLSTTDDIKHGLPIILFSTFIVITILIVLFMAPSLGSADQLGERQLLPVYVPVIIIVLLLLDILLRRLLLRWKPLEFALVCLILTGILGSISFSARWHINTTARSLEINAEHQIFETFGYSKNMELWTYLRDNSLDGQIYSNGHHLLYWFTDVSFEGVIVEDRGLDHCLRWVQSFVNSPEPTYIIYFPGQRINLSTYETYNSCNIQELAFDSSAQRYLENIIETSEAIIYKVLQVQPAFTVRVLDKTTLIYTKNNCTSADIKPHFFLHIIPIDANTLPSDRISFKFDNLDFHFSDYGAIIDNKCIATIKLPLYGISMIRTGQKDRSEGKLWGIELSIR